VQFWFAFLVLSFAAGARSTWRRGGRDRRLVMLAVCIVALNAVLLWTGERARVATISFALAIVAMFTVTEDPGVPRRVRLEMQKRSRWDWLRMFVRPGGGRGAAWAFARRGARSTNGAPSPSPSPARTVLRFTMGPTCRASARPIGRSRGSPT